ncbi:hypothetical protein JKP88DRAFT_205214 [Tribonema minus]|uniref:Tyrosine-protein kinase ephrin type A/B receptor-like domain-containing protein n=1 Tax=Tribonema minus TaxID=303371 RepID=A0A835ZBR7_9STRA|nr:hypothetical protein JKP88DRAFT_205214 [Tribonema minus]
MEDCKAPRNATAYAVVRTHPYAVADATRLATLTQFCEAGCAYFYSSSPTLQSCDVNCDEMYRQRTSFNVSDWAEKARLDCRDGCRIGFRVCQPGYKCEHAHGMVECEPGTYRNASDADVTQCIACPAGHYREAPGGAGLLDCSPCPRGTFLGAMGSSSQQDCKRCPDGLYTLVEGQAACANITYDSGNPEFQNLLNESEPFLGRW